MVDLDETLLKSCHLYRELLGVLGIEKQVELL